MALTISRDKCKSLADAVDKLSIQGEKNKKIKGDMNLLFAAFVEEYGKDFIESTTTTFEVLSIRWGKVTGKLVIEIKLKDGRVLVSDCDDGKVYTLGVGDTFSVDLPIDLKKRINFT